LIAALNSFRRKDTKVTRKPTTINGVTAQAANKLARAATDEIAHMQREDRENFYDKAASCQDMIDRIVTIYGESARASAERVAAGLLKVKFGNIGDDEPGARLQKNRPGEFRVHTHRREAPSLRQIIAANKARAEADKEERENQWIHVDTEP
jgi:hypothetical protein